MVGVPGRSKGCNTCRKRRVKCDETKPTCTRCKKGRFQCLGYERPRIWHHSSTAPFPDPKLIPHATTHRIQSPPPELSLVAFQDDFCISFMFSNFIWRSYGTLWLDQAAEGKLGGLALDATKALSEANFGRSNHLPEIELRGSVQYGKCLNRLSAAIEKEIVTGQEGQFLIVPILVLIMHAGSYSDRTGAMFHLRGLSRLLYSCGPEAFQHQPLLNAFEAARSTLLIAGLVGKQRLFFDDEVWRSVPWAQNPKLKTPQSELLDILVVIPGILQDHAKFVRSAISGPPLHGIIGRVEKQLVLVYQWRWKWQAMSGNQVSFDEYEKRQVSKSTSATIRHGEGPKKFQWLRFGRFTAATEIMMYNATLMWLLALLWKLDPVGAAQRIEAYALISTPSGNAATQTSFTPLQRPGAVSRVRDPAIEICKVFEWVSRCHGRSKGPALMYLFPIGMAMSVLDVEPEYRTWARSLLQRSPLTANYAQGDSPAGFGFYVTRQSLHPEMVQANEQVFSSRDIAVTS